MKRLIIILAAAVLASIHVTAQTIMTNLTEQQQALVAIAAHEAKGDLQALRSEVNKGLDAGLTVSQIKEALSQLYAYTGFPRSLNALGVLQQVVERRKEVGLPTAEGRDADPLPADYDALKQGTAVQTQLVGGQPFTYAFAPQTDYYLKAHLFGDIFARNNLTFAEREIVTVSAISALPGCDPQLKAHVSGARNMGVGDAQLRQLPAVLRHRVGEAEAVRLEQAVAAVFGEPCQTIAPVDFDVWPRGEKNPYGAYFNGQSYLAPMGPVTNVTFEPRCRNNWHVHHGQVQVLICVAGRGWYQEWGKPAVEMKPGTVIAIPAEAKHWHGAARDSWFQHLTYHTDVHEGASNEWLEPVTDEWYDQLQ